MEYIVDSVKEALALLMIVAQKNGLGVTEIARLSGNTKARAFRLLSTLEESAFLQRERGTSNYQLGHMSLVLGLAAQKQVSLVKLAMPHIELLSKKYNENVQVIVRDGFERVLIALIESTHPLRVHSNIGHRNALHVGASGKLLLTQLSADQLEKYFEHYSKNVSVENKLPESEIRARILEVSAKGYAHSRNEATTGITAFAVPIFQNKNLIIASLSMSMPCSREPADHCDVVASMKSTAQNISRDLGYPD